MVATQLQTHAPSFEQAQRRKLPAPLPESTPAVTMPLVHRSPARGSSTPRKQQAIPLSGQFAEQAREPALGSLSTKYLVVRRRVPTHTR